MKEGYASHLIITPTQRYRSAIALIDEQNVLVEILNFNREMAFTRFYDGALMLLRQSDLPEKITGSPCVGEPVSIWQLFPFDLHNRCELPQTRKLRIR